MLKISVFLMIGQKLYDVTKRSKCASPTHGLPLMPSTTLKLRNAICTPYIGQYVKTIRYNTGRANMAYNCQPRRIAFHACAPRRGCDTGSGCGLAAITVDAVDGAFTTRMMLRLTLQRPDQGALDEMLLDERVDEEQRHGRHHDQRVFEEI